MEEMNGAGTDGAGGSLGNGLRFERAEEGVECLLSLAEEEKGPGGGEMQRGRDRLRVGLDQECVAACCGGPLPGLELEPQLGDKAGLRARLCTRKRIWLCTSLCAWLGEGLDRGAGVRPRPALKRGGFCARGQAGQSSE
jgi:hypothetical protein